jgi:hypothetical protein
MKTLSSGMQAHVLQETTTLATMWSIIRAVDGAAFYFTDHDQDIVYEGNTYVAANSYTRSAMKSNDTYATDNINVIGILDSDQITQEDLEGGKFDYAKFTIFMVNWANLSDGVINLRTGTFSETILTPTGTFQVELRGLTQFLIQETATNYQPTCRADLGDTACGIPLVPEPWLKSTSYFAGPAPALLSYVSDPNASSDTEKLAIYQCTTAGTSGSTAPTFNPTVGATTSDGGVVWTSIQPWRAVAFAATVTDNGTFTVSGVSGLHPNVNGDTEQIDILFNGPPPLLGYTVHVVTGAKSLAIDISFGISAPAAINQIVAAINAANDAGAIDATASPFFGVFTGDQAGDNGGPEGTAAVNIYKTVSSESGSVTIGGNPGTTVVVTGGDDEEGNWTGSETVYLNGGLVTWQTGNNAGYSMEIKNYTPSTSTVELFLKMPFAVQAGDKLYFQPGCNKSRRDCYYVFGNINNFRGEPDVPGMDKFTTYPGV